MYMCGGLGESFQDTSMVLNRLVDPEMVKCMENLGYDVQLTYVKRNAAE